MQQQQQQHSNSAILDLIIRVDNFLDVETKWTKFAMARETNNDSVTVNNPAACSWCLLGAMRKCDYINLTFNEKVEFSEIISHITGIDSIVNFNDNVAINFSDIKSVLARVKESLTNAN